MLAVLLCALEARAVLVYAESPRTDDSYWFGPKSTFSVGHVRSTSRYHTVSYSFLFKLPSKLPAERVLSANLSVPVRTPSGTDPEWWLPPNFDVDVYGLPAQTTRDIPWQGMNQYGAYGTDPAAVPIQKSFASRSISYNGQSVALGLQGQRALVDYLNSNYDAGAAGKYVLLRFNPDYEEQPPDMWGDPLTPSHPDWDSNWGYSCTYILGISSSPQAVIMDLQIGVPEPGSAGALVMAAVLLCRRTRRR